MKRILFLIVLLLVLGLLFAAHTASQSGTGQRSGAVPQATRRNLAQDTVIQGYPCAKGYAWFCAGDKLNRAR